MPYQLSREQTPLFPGGFYGIREGLEHDFDYAVRNGYEAFAEHSLPFLFDTISDPFDTDWVSDYDEAWTLVEHSLAQHIYGKDYEDLDEDEELNINYVFHDQYWHLEDNFLDDVETVLAAHNIFYIRADYEAQNATDYAHFEITNSPLQEVW
jgi:hypothetical protein